MSRRRGRVTIQTIFFGLMTAALAVLFLVAPNDTDLSENEDVAEVLPTKELNKEITNEIIQHSNKKQRGLCPK